MIVYATLLILFVYALSKERESLGCFSIFENLFQCKDCDNAQGKAVRGTSSSEKDSNDDIFQKIKLAASYSDRFVIWRFCFILGLLATILIHFLTFSSFPSEKDLIIGTLVVFSMVYFAMNFYKFHLVSYIRKNIEKSIEILKERT